MSCWKPYNNPPTQFYYFLGFPLRKGMLSSYTKTPTDADDLEDIWEARRRKCVEHIANSQPHTHIQ